MLLFTNKARSRAKPNKMENRNTFEFTAAPYQNRVFVPNTFKRGIFP